MKVLFINTVYERGSTGRIVKDIGQRLEREGHEYMVAYGRGEVSFDPHCYRIGNTLSVGMHVLMARLLDGAGFYSRHATQKLVAFIREYQPDVIHLHNLHGYYLNIAVLFDYLKREYTGQVVWTLHDCWAFTGHCTYYSYAQCDKWKKCCHNCPEKKRYPTSILLDCSDRNFKLKKALFTGVPNLTIITVSQWLKEQAKTSFLGNYDIHRVYNGIDSDVFHPIVSDVRERLGIGDQRMILCVSDGWDQRKGFGRLLDVMTHAPQDWRFVIVGLNKKQIAGLPGNATGMERTWDRNELVKLYTAADVFYNPSVEETFGLVTAEALACGTPVVVYNATACPELVCDETCGEVIPVDASAKEAIASIERVMKLKTGESKNSFLLEKSICGNIKLYVSRSKKMQDL